MGKIQKIRWFERIEKLNLNIICNFNKYYILVTNDTRIDSKNRKEPRFAYPSKTSRKHPSWLYHSSFGLKFFYVTLKIFWIFLKIRHRLKKDLNSLKAKLSGQHFTSISKKGWHKLKLSSLDATENSLNLSDIEVFGTSLEIIELAFNEMTQISLINPGLR